MTRTNNIGPTTDPWGTPCSVRALTCWDRTNLIKRFVEVYNSLNPYQVVTNTIKAPMSTTSSQIYLGESNTSTQMFCPAPLSVTATHRILTWKPRYEYIRKKNQFDETVFEEDFYTLPLEMVYGLQDPSEQTSALNSLIPEFLDRHVPLRRTKVTRPPAPCLNDLDLRSLQEQCWRNRLEVHSRPHSEHAWKAIWGARNKLKKVITKEKRTLLINAFLSKRRKKVWKTNRWPRWIGTSHLRLNVSQLLFQLTWGD